MLQYLQNVMKLQLAGYQWFFLHQGDYCKHLVLELCAMVMWTSSGGSVRVIFADASCSIVGNSGNSILNSFPIIASLLLCSKCTCLKLKPWQPKHLWHQKVARSLSVCELEKHHQVLCWMGGREVDLSSSKQVACSILCQARKLPTKDDGRHMGRET